MPELNQLDGQLLKQQLTEDLSDLVIWGQPASAPFFSQKVMHHRKWETYALASYGTRMGQEQERFAQAAMALKLFACAAMVIPATRETTTPPTPPIFCRFAATSSALTSLREMMASLSAFFRPIEDLTSPTLADGYAGLIQPTGRIVIAGPRPFIAQLHNRVLDAERNRLDREAADNRKPVPISPSIGIIPF